MIKYFLHCIFVVLVFNQTIAQTTYTVQPDGTTGIDAWVLSEYTPNNDTSNNYGTDARLDAWRWTNSGVPYSTRAYLKFDVSSLPTTAVVCSAILTVHTDANNEMSGSNQPNAFYLKRATSSWTQSGVTWHNQPTLSTTNIISVGSYTSTTAGTSYTIDVSSHIQDMINNPSTNYGWAIMLQNESNTYAALGLASSNHATPAYRPMLTVVYVSSLTVTPTSTTLCAGGSSTLTVSGASTYSWTPSSGLSATTGTSVVATPTASITYTVTGTTGSCSTSKATVAITVNPLPTLSVSPSSPSICYGSSTTFTASGASTYTWTPNTSLSCSVCASPVANPTATTNYTITGTNSNGCINTKAVTLTVNPLPTLSVSPSSPSICYGSSTTFTASGASTYTWTPNTSLSCSVCASPVANPTATTNYTITGTNSNGCINTKAVTLTVNPLPTLSVSPSSPSICYGSSTTFTASGASTYTWTPYTSLTCSVCPSPVANPTATTNYTVTGTNSNGCINTKAVTLTVSPRVVVNSADTIYGSLTATLTASGATTYSWTPSTGLSATTGSTVIASPTVTTTYTVTGTLGTCTTTAIATVTNLNIYFRSTQTGNWNQTSTWQSSTNNSTWVSATATPNYKSLTTTVQSSHTVTITASVKIDETVVNGTLVYGNNTGSTITINNGTGTDLTINGIFQDIGPNDISWSSSSTWLMGSSGTLLRTRATNSDNWRDYYDGGISTIPATGNWIVRKTGSDNPLLTSTGGMYYPNLTIENTSGTWITSGNSCFNGSSGYPTIKGNMSIGGTGAGNVSFLDTNVNANPVMIKGNFTINSGSTFRSHGTGYEVQGNLILNGTIDYGTSSATVSMSGSNNQTISGSSLQFKKFKINKTNTAATVTLNSPLSISDTCTFVMGVLKTDTVNLLTFNAGSSTTGVNDSSFVSGPVKKIGNTDFIFPLGKNQNSQTIEISAPSNSTDAFQAEYFDTNPTILYGNNTDVTFDYISTCQFFKLLRKNGTSNVTPTLSFDLTSCVVNMLPAPRVIGFDGTKWKDLGQANLTYSIFGGTISTASVITQYGPITLGNNDTGVDTIVADLTPPIDFNSDPPSNAFLYYKNSGQIGYTNGTSADSVKYYSEFTYPKLFFQNTKMSFLFGRHQKINDTLVVDSLHRIDLSFIESNTNAKINSFDQTTTRFNYLADSITAMGNRGLIVPNIYPNIDLQIYSNKDGLKYYFVVKPGGKPQSIAHFFNGAISCSISSGSLTINSALDNFTLNEPIAYQVDSIGGVTLMSWAANWVNITTNKYKFNVGTYLTNRLLIFEVTSLSTTASTTAPYWSTCISSTSDDAGRALAYDPISGWVFVGGETSSPTSNGFPVSSTVYGFTHLKNIGTDAFILSFDSLRNIGWGTYFGGNGINGSNSGGNYIYDMEFSTCATCDSFPNAGRLYVVGETYGNGNPNTFPIKNKPGAYSQSQPYVGSGISGMGYIARFYTGSGLPANQVFGKIGQPDWITNFGSFWSKITGVDEDPRNNDVYIVGTQFNGPASTATCTGGVTNNFSNCGTTPAFQQGGFAGSGGGGSALSDGSISKFNSNCQLGWSTMVGGNGDDFLTDVAIDTSSSSVYAIGTTYSNPTTLPTHTWSASNYNDATNPFYASTSNVFITKFSTLDHSRQWITTYGGSYQDEGRQVEVNSVGDVYIVGITNTPGTVTCTDPNVTTSTWFPVCSTGSEYTQTYGGGYDNFILKFAANNSLQWSTFIGGSGQEIFDPSAEWRGSPAIAIDNTNDNVYVCGTSFSSSGSFTLTNSTVFDYNQSTNSQSGSNAYIFAVDNTDQIIWGTFFGGVGTKSINSTYAGANVNVGEFGIDILATNNNVFLTGLSYGSTTSLPFVHPPSNSGAWVHPHSSSLNSDAYISEFNTTSGIGIKSFTSPNKINEYLFYPNPTTGHLNIKGMFPENSIIQVSNVMGQMIYTSRHHHSETEVAIDLSNLSNGIYMVNILNGHSSVSQKIVIFK